MTTPLNTFKEAVEKAIYKDGSSVDDMSAEILTAAHTLLNETLEEVATGIGTKFEGNWNEELLLKRSIMTFIRSHKSNV